MGLPYQTMSGQYGAGAVMVAFGTPYGIDSNPQIWSQDSAGIPGICEYYDQFGYSLTAADFNDDGKWDLAIGAPGENTNSGVVHVLFGQYNGLDSWATRVRWQRGSWEVQVSGGHLKQPEWFEPYDATRLTASSKPSLNVKKWRAPR